MAINVVIHYSSFTTFITLFVLYLWIYIYPCFLKMSSCCKLRVMNDHIDGHYELHLLIFKMSSGSSYYEAYKRLLTPHVRASGEKERKVLPLILSLSLFLSLSQFSSLIPSSILYIKVRYVLSLLLWFALYYICPCFTTYIIIIIGRRHNERKIVGS